MSFHSVATHEAFFHSDTKFDQSDINIFNFLLRIYFFNVIAQTIITVIRLSITIFVFIFWRIPANRVIFSFSPWISLSSSFIVRIYIISLFLLYFLPEKQDHSLKNASFRLTINPKSLITNILGNSYNILTPKNQKKKFFWKSRYRDIPSVEC